MALELQGNVHGGLRHPGFHIAWEFNCPGGIHFTAEDAERAEIAEAKCCHIAPKSANPSISAVSATSAVQDV